MRLLASRLPTYAAIASIICLSLTFAGDAAAEDDIALPNAGVKAAISDEDFEILNNGGKKKHHHLRHHHSKKKKNDKRILNLICDGVVIDNLVCKYKIPPPTIVYGQSPVEESQTPFGTLNNGGGGGKVVNVFIVMDKPCSKYPPRLTAIANAEDGSEESEEPEDSGSDTRPDAEDEDDTEKDHGVGADGDVDTNTGDTDLWKKNHHRNHGKHHRDRHGKHRHNGHHHHNKHDRHNRKKPKHPYKDLCVAVGEFCGDNLYGCNFEFKTRYLCKAVGEKPIVVERNAESCSGTDNGKCKCPISRDGKPVCGGSLDPQCKADPTAIYYCPGGTGSDPKILRKCVPGTQCNTDKDGNANCGYSTCKCSGDVVACSQLYPGECQLVPNSVYKCSSSGVPELVKTCSNAEECVSVIDGAYCANKDCKCPVDGKVCGNAFPISCRLSASTIYTCKKGQDPVPLKSCEPGTCSASAATSQASGAFADDQCINDCTCVTKGKVCGSTFSPKCNLDAQRIYQCDGAGTAPKPLELCRGRCLTQAGGAVCTDSGDKCECPISSNGKPVCGGDLNPLCKADPTSIYHCPNGAGSQPQILKKCLPGTQCNTDRDGNANCGYSTCECTGDVVACSELYPTSCRLVPNSVYKCGSRGVPELVKTCSNAEECVSVVDGAYCANKNCKCVNDGNFCGNSFPISCRLSSSTIYSCKRGQDPVPIRSCEPGTCSSSANNQAANVFGNDQCIAECTCASKGKVCGSTFSPKCSLDAQRIYQCDGSGTAPKPLELCQDKCISQAGGAICSNSGDKCKCPISSTGKPVCGGNLDPNCKADPTAIYHCPDGTGSDPKILKKCIPGTQCNTDKDGNANCGYSTCKCSGDVVACSEQYPTECKLVPNSIYKCNSSGVPELLKTCCEWEECVALVDGAICANKDCKCPNDGKICGNAFPISCRLSASTIYDCKKGENPIPFKNCEPGTCSASAATAQASDVFAEDKCINDCMCVNKGKVCGSTFPPKCNLEAQRIYQCDGAGIAPKPLELCRQCLTQAGGAICADTKDKCECPISSNGKPVCGANLNPLCNADPTAIYHCPDGDGSQPQILKKCLPGTQCSTDKDNNAHCVYPTCECTKDFVACSDQFPEECKLLPKSVYKCTKGGKPVLIQECCESEDCVSRGDDAHCIPKTVLPTVPPTNKPTIVPTVPTNNPTGPTNYPTDPTNNPTGPTNYPTNPTNNPTGPTNYPTDPTNYPTGPTSSGVVPTKVSTAVVPTPTTDCLVFIKPITDLIQKILTMIDSLPLHAPVAALLKLALGDNLTNYVNGGLDGIGSVAATIAVFIPQVVAVLRNATDPLRILGVTGPFLDILFDLLNQFAKLFADLAACTGAKPDCTGLIILAGYTIRIGWPILRADLAFKAPWTIPIFIATQPIVDRIAAQLIAGNDGGITDMLTFLVDTLAGPLKALPVLGPIFDILTPILNLIKDCDKNQASSKTIGPTVVPTNPTNLPTIPPTNYPTGPTSSGVVPTK
ncbi:hypothetical protein BGZ83_007201, partial [Gryganskiella cystojenkinii]